MGLSISLLVILITVIASIYAWKNRSIYNKWMMNPYRVNHNNEYYRFITSGFIHADGQHLFFNMFSFFMFSFVVEREMGILNFLILYLVGIVVSDLPTYFKYKNASYYNSLGASGGVSSIIFASIMLEPMGRISLYFIPMRSFIFGIVYLILSYYMAKRGGDNINHDAHFYGAVFGLVYPAVIMPGVLNDFFNQIANYHF
ncbi:MAG: rhomboid family intramembrane serine protease [Cytophagaceae bacterium]